jgi:hypothetical protein
MPRRRVEGPRQSAEVPSSGGCGMPPCKQIIARLDAEAMMRERAEYWPRCLQKSLSAAVEELQKLPVC